MSILSPMLFYVPDGHLEDLVKMTVDQLVSEVSWNKLARKLTAQWQEFNVLVCR